MKKAKILLQKLLFPPKWVLFLVPPAVFALLIWFFATGETESAAAYVLYVLSAYSLTVWVIAAVKLIRRIRSIKENIREHGLPVKRKRSSDFAQNMLSDPSFRGKVNIWQGMAANFLYVILRTVNGIQYASVWFLSMAAYHLLLGILRLYLIFCYRKSLTLPEEDRQLYEYRCYGKTAWWLFLLNLPMSGMATLMILANAGFSYPGNVIYLSAAYTFYMMILSIVNLVRYRRLGSPVLSAARALNFIAATMSLLGLQTAMIAHFSPADDESFRLMMNTITGAVVCATVIALAVYMIVHAYRCQKSLKAREEIGCEQIGK